MLRAQLTASRRQRVHLGKSLPLLMLRSNRPGVRVDFGQLPLRFEPNQGQTDPRVKFLARGAGYGLFLTADQAVLTLRSPSTKASVQSCACSWREQTPPRPPLDQSTSGQEQLFRRQRPGEVASRHSAICAGALSGAFIPALTWCTTATRDSWSTTSKSLPARTPANRVAVPGSGKRQAGWRRQSGPGQRRRRGG